jgi:transcriptional regulator with GAF, ATPase, and Fis domain
LSQRQEHGIAAHGCLESRIEFSVLQVLDQTGWTIEGQRGAAALLGLRPSTLRGRMRRLGVQRPPVG